MGVFPLLESAPILCPTSLGYSSKYPFAQTTYTL